TLLSSYPTFSPTARPPPTSTLFPYTTLFRSYMKDDGKEIWLEKTEKNKSNVIRLQQGGFDWKNHLKRDIAQVFQITKNMKKILRSEEHTSELQSRFDLVCRLLLEKKKQARA